MVCIVEFLNPPSLDLPQTFAAKWPACFHEFTSKKNSAMPVNWVGDSSCVSFLKLYSLLQQTSLVPHRGACRVTHLEAAHQLRLWDFALERDLSCSFLPVSQPCRATSMCSLWWDCLVLLRAQTSAYKFTVVAARAAIGISQMRGKKDASYSKIVLLWCN